MQGLRGGLAGQASSPMRTTVCASMPLMKMGTGSTPSASRQAHQLRYVALLGDHVLPAQHACTLRLRSLRAQPRSFHTASNAVGTISPGFIALATSRPTLFSMFSLAN